MNQKPNKRTYKTTYPMVHGKKLKHVKMFENFDMNESGGQINAVFYKWGKYLEDDQIDASEIKDMVRLGEDELSGFDLRDEDEDLVFFALDRDIDDTNSDEDGYGVKRAWGVRVEDLDRLGLNENELLVRDGQNIPVLSDNATWTDVEKYLKWLRTSEYAYHIDDNPEEIDSFSEDVQRVLSRNSNIMWKWDDKKLWDTYSGGDAEVIKFENSDEGDTEHVLVPVFIPHFKPNETQNALQWVITQAEENEALDSYLRTEVGTFDIVRVGDVRLVGSDVQDHLSDRPSNESKLLADIFKEAKKSKNFSEVKMQKANQDDWVGDVIYIKSKLKGESDYHEDDYDEFEIGIDADSGSVILHYIPSGNDSEIESLKDFIEMTRSQK